MSNMKAPAIPGLVASLFAFVLVPVLWGPAPAAAQLASELPANFYGTYLDEGDVVVAYIGGEECGSSTVTDGLWLITLQLNGCDGRAVSGATVTFTVNGAQADQSWTWTPGFAPDDPIKGIDLTVGGGAGRMPVSPGGPPEPPRLSRTQGLAIFSGGSLDDLEAAGLAACPGGVTIWANEPGGNSYLPFVAGALVPIVNRPFTSAYPDGFDGPEPVIVKDCVTAGG